MTRPAHAFVLGYHGCDRGVGERLLANTDRFVRSDRAYDWLGPGVYFWENDPQRAWEWAKSLVARGKIADAFVVGAVIDLGHCFDLTLRENIELLASAYDMLAGSGLVLPVNEGPTDDPDKVLRYRDCAVVKTVHALVDSKEGRAAGMKPFDTVRGLFVEGPEVYPGAGFHRLTHTQIAVRNDACIRGVFVPR